MDAHVTQVKSIRVNSETFTGAVSLLAGVARPGRQKPEAIGEYLVITDKKIYISIQPAHWKTKLRDGNAGKERETNQVLVKLVDL